MDEVSLLKWFALFAAGGSGGGVVGWFMRQWWKRADHNDRTALGNWQKVVKRLDDEIRGLRDDAEGMRDEVRGKQDTIDRLWDHVRRCDNHVTYQEGMLREARNTLLRYNEIFTKMGVSVEPVFAMPQREWDHGERAQDEFDVRTEATKTRLRNDLDSKRHQARETNNEAGGDNNGEEGGS